MNKKFNIIINTLIILLIIALVMVMMNYYADTDIIPTFIYNSGETTEIKGSGDYQIIDTILSGEKSGDNAIENISGDTNEESGESQENINSGDNEKIKTQPEKSDSPLIMTSENEISSKEKREILTELDKTLMDLLEVVDRVQIVDEARLITDDSEVQ